MSDPVGQAGSQTGSEERSNIRTYQGIAPQLGERVFVDRTAVLLGDVHLGDDCSVWPLAVIRGDMHHIRIGARTSVQDGAVLHITHASDYNPGGYPLIIGDDVTIGHQAMLHGCTIGNRVLIGMKSMIMDGAVVEDEVIVAAGATVSPGKVLESGYVYMGTPAKKVRPITDKERSFFTYGAGNYVRLKDKHLAEGYDK
jgi:carbonic anhydrase/acetyltransferase-like protein (isoleucine patch superfamily)